MLFRRYRTLRFSTSLTVKPRPSDRGHVSSVWVSGKSRRVRLALTLLFPKVWNIASPIFTGPRPSDRGLPCGSQCLDMRGLLALTLLMPRVFADDHDATVPANYLALVADPLNAGLDLHCRTFFCRPAIAANGASKSGLTYSGTRSVRGTGRRASAPQPRGPQEGS